MKCSSPYVRDPTTGGIRLSYGDADRLGHIPFPCGQCLACRINRRRVWTGRLLIELNYHAKSSFITLTYAPETLPKNGSLVKSHLQKFFKRLRKHGFSFRYYAVGEYGDKNFRPHYHIAFFGISPDDLPKVHEIWGFGKTHAGNLTPDSAQYVAGYILKKMTKKDDPRLGDRCPEFSLMSRKPAIGLIGVDDIAKSLAKSPLFLREMNKHNSSPIAFTTMGKKYPLGRYLRSKLNDKFAFNDLEGNVTRYSAEIIKNIISKRKEGINFYQEIYDNGELNEKRIAFLSNNIKQRTFDHE